MQAVAEHCGGDIHQAVDLLDVSPATCRRWLRKAAARRREIARPASWIEVQEALAELVRLPLAEVRGVGARRGFLRQPDGHWRVPRRLGRRFGGSQGVASESDHGIATTLDPTVNHLPGSEAAGAAALPVNHDNAAARFPCASQATALHSGMSSFWAIMLG